MPEHKILEGFLTVEELAEGLNKSVRTVERWIAQPDGLPYTMLGNRRLFRPEAVREWIIAREQQRNPRRQGRRAA